MYKGEILMKTINLLICLVLAWTPVFATLPNTVDEAINMAHKQGSKQKHGLYTDTYTAYVKHAGSVKAAIEYLDVRIGKIQKTFNEYNDLFTKDPGSLRYIYERKCAEIELLEAQALKTSLKKNLSQAITDIQILLGAEANEIEEEHRPMPAHPIEAPQSEKPEATGQVGYLVPLWEKYLFNGAEELPLEEMKQILEDAITEKVKEYNYVLSYSLTQDEWGNPISDFARRARMEGQEEAHRMLPYFRALQETIHNDPHLAIDNIHNALGAQAQRMKDLNDQEMLKAKRSLALSVRSYLDPNKINELKDSLKETMDLYHKDYKLTHGSRMSTTPFKRQGIAAKLSLYQLDANPQKTIDALKKLIVYKKQSGC